MTTPTPVPIWDDADDGWNPLTAPRPPFVERRSVARCESCGHPAGDPLRGEPDSPTVQRIAEVAALLRATEPEVLIAIVAVFAGADRDRAEGES